MKHHYRYTALFLLILVGFFYSCEKIYDPITIRGKVVDVNSGSAVSNAEVAIISPQDLAAITFSNESGDFFFEEVNVDSVIDVTIAATKEGFSIEQVTILAAPERELVVPDLKIRNLESGTGDGSVTGRTGGAAAIELINISNTVINIQETGGNVNSAFTFEVQDSTGRPIGPDNATDVVFEIVEGPGGAEGISPTVVRTNDNGRVTSNIFSGNRAGNLKIEARIERPEVGLTIRSKPILLTIHGGFPDLAHFSIAASIFNFEGYAINGNRNPISVIVGDEFSNPVKPGTPVYFNTTMGVIQGSGTTDDDGQVTVDLISGEPRQPTGFATIRAHTFDESDTEIVRNITVLFSGPPSNQTIDVSPSTFDIGPNGSQRFTMTLTDINGNPLPFNTSVTVTAPDGMEVDGDVDFRIPNTLASGPGTTEFSFTARDSDDESNARQEVSIRIEVETPGGFIASKTISGFKAKGL